jgi:hypothetical protein
MSRLTTGGLVLDLDPRTLEEVGRAVVKILREQQRRRIDADGNAYPRGANGRQLDLRETGELWRRIVVVARPPLGVEVVFDSPHASHVASRVPYAGVAPQMRGALIAEVQRIIDRAAGRNR